MRITALLGALCLMLLTVPARSQLETMPTIPVPEPNPPTRFPGGLPKAKPVLGFAAGVSLDFGGDDVAVVNFDNGDSQTITAGDGVSLFVGGLIRLDGQGFNTVRATVGYKVADTAASNADIRMSRIPFEVVFTHSFVNGIRLGGGLVHHTDTKLYGDNYFEDVEFDSATGYRIEAGWKWVLLQYTGIEYDVSGVDATIDGSNFGLLALIEF
jgi:hypothetical protein